MSRASKTYKLVAEEVPASTRGGGSIWAEIVSEFVKTKSSSARVEVPHRKSSTIHQGLIKAAKDAGTGVSVVKRGGAIYLARKK